MDIKIILLTALSAFIGSIGQLEFKLGADTLQLNIKSFLTNHHIVIGILLYVLSTLIYIYALTMGRLSIIYPIIATSYIWTTLFAQIYLHEPVNLINWIGLFFILIGVTLITWIR